MSVEQEQYLLLNTIKSRQLQIKPNSENQQLFIELAAPHLVYSDSVDVGVIYKPDDLVGEEFTVVLRGQVGLGGLGGVQLQTFADALSQHVQGRVGLHDLSHGLLDQRLASREPVAVGTKQGKQINIQSMLSAFF